MSHSYKSSVNVDATNPGDEVKRTILHDFIGRGCVADSTPAAANVGSEFGMQSGASPSAASPSVGAASGAEFGPASATRDLGSENQVANQFEGVPLHGQRSDLSGSAITDRCAGGKRSKPGSTFIATYRDAFPQIGQDSLGSSSLMKVPRNSGGERPRRPLDDETFFGMHPIRPTSASLILQPPTGGKAVDPASKWERAVPLNVGHTVQYPPQTAPFGYQVPFNRFKDSNVGPSVISQAAADEGSRTGIKGSGILSSNSASCGVSDRNPSLVLARCSKQKSGLHISEPGSSNPPSRQQLASTSHQMTIFYGGQAHVFDDVQPNKAEVILALAGSNGGSWSTTYAPKSLGRPPFSENYLPSNGNDGGTTSKIETAQECRRRLVTSNPSPGNAVSIPPGLQLGSIAMKDARTTAGSRTERGETPGMI